MTTQEKLDMATLELGKTHNYFHQAKPNDAHRAILATIAWLTDLATDIEAPLPPEPDVWLLTPNQPPHLIIELYEYPYQPASKIHRN